MFSRVLLDNLGSRFHNVLSISFYFLWLYQTVGCISWHVPLLFFVPNLFCSSFACLNVYTFIYIYTYISFFELAVVFFIIFYFFLFVEPIDTCSSTTLNNIQLNIEWRIKNKEYWGKRYVINYWIIVCRNKMYREWDVVFKIDQKTKTISFPFFNGKK